MDQQGFMQRSGLRLPHYKPPPVIKQEMVNSLYPEKWPGYNNDDVENRVDNILGPLSLFAPYPHEAEPPHKLLDIERPVTPIDEEIKAQPSSFDLLSKFVRRRIAPQPNVPHLSKADQQNLAGILIGEVNNIWPDVRRQIGDPFLNADENKELNRRVTVHVVTVCEQLFQHYLQKAEVLNSRGIFSGPANMSRLKAQLSLDAGKFLNVRTIRRYIVSDLKGHGEEESDAGDEFSPLAKFRRRPDSKQAQLSNKALIQSSRPKSKTKRRRYHTAEQDLKEISDNMPSLDTSKLMYLVADLPERGFETPSLEEEFAADRISEVDSRASSILRDTVTREKMSLQRSESMPHVQQGETIYEELGIDDDRMSTITVHECDLLRDRSTQGYSKCIEEVEKPKIGSREFAANDLHHLISKPPDDEGDEEDLAPLLQAITRNAKHDGIKDKLDKQLLELEEKERLEKEAQSIPLREPLHPQPATISTKLPNKMVVRASDIRVSERVCMSSVTLNRYATVYNDLVDEVDAAMVKQLDKNLFLGQEIRDVYKEIMKTVPNDHLDLDNDPLIENTGENVSLEETLASATLGWRPTDRVINPNLQHQRQPPWGDMGMKKWVRTPTDPPKNFSGEPVFPPMTPNIDKINDVLHSPSKTSQLLATESIPSFMAEKIARTYASWLQWWKSTVNSDDYMKYLSTQETDYLAALFHFYDSEDEDDDYEMAGYRNYKSTSKIMMSNKTSKTREKEKKIEEMKAQKTEFKDGFWNVNSVLMGGLGSEPSIDEEEEIKAKSPVGSVKSAVTLQEKVKQARLLSAKSGREGAISATSKVTLSGATGSKSPTTTTAGSPQGDGQLGPQERLERIWTALEMTDALKLDMAIKYSCNEYYIKLAETIDCWEWVTNLILRRETVLEKLEKFERKASDPNRFFERGRKGSSAARLEEAKQRSHLYKKIDSLDAEIKTDLDMIWNKFRDTVTFKARPYMEKMKFDRIEMLFWLQEERKENALRYEAMTKQLPLKMAQLEPIPAVRT